MKTVLLSTAYLPPVSYFYFLLNAEHSILEKHENYQKQSYRNRCEILSANGKLSLYIPLTKSSEKEAISRKQISYAENWQNVHWRAITSAYKNAPYFDYFEDDFRYFFLNQFKFLFNYNLELIQLILKMLRVKKEIILSEEYHKKIDFLDLRESLHPKKNISIPGIPVDEYQQVFSDKFGFTKNLSIIDLLFNKGLGSVDYLAGKG